MRTFLANTMTYHVAPLIEKYSFIVLQSVFFSLLGFFIGGLFLRSALLPVKKTIIQTKVCLVLLFYVDLNLYILTYKITDFSLYLVGLVCIFIVFVSCIFLVYLSWRETQDKDSFFIQVQKYYSNFANSVDYRNLREFWKVDFPKCKARPLLYAVWEYPILVLASFYTFARTRLALFQTLFVIRATGLVFFGNFYWLLAYIVPILFLTVLFSIDFIKEYFDKIYGPNSVKKIGWNHWWTVGAQISPAVGRTLFTGAVGFGCVTAGSELSNPAYREALVNKIYDIDEVVIRRGGLVDPIKTAARVDAIRDSNRTLGGDCFNRIGQFYKDMSEPDKK